MSADMPTPSEKHPVLAQFDALKAQIETATKGDLSKLQEVLESSLAADFAKLKEEMNGYIDGEEKPELKESEVIDAVKIVANGDPESAKYLMDALGFGPIDPYTQSVDFHKRDNDDILDTEDFTRSEEPSESDEEDGGAETGKEEEKKEMTDTEKREKAKADLSGAIGELGDVYDEFASKVKAGEKVEPQDFPEQKIAIEKAFADLLALKSGLGLKEEEIIAWVDAAGDNNVKKELFLLTSVLAYTGIRSKDLPINEKDFELSADYIGDEDEDIDLSEVNGETASYLIDTYKKTKEEGVDRNKNSTVVQTLVSDFPEFINGEERYSGDDVKLRLRDIVEHMLANKDQYEEYGVVRGAKKLGGGVKELGRDMMGGSAEESGAAVTDAFNKVLWTSTPETLKVSNPQKLSRLLDMSFKEIIENPQEAYKKIDELVAQYEATDTSELTEGFLKLKDNVGKVSVEDLMKPVKLENKEGETEEGEEALGLSPEILKYVGPEVAQELQRLGNTISTPHRGQPFGNEYMRYLAQTTIDGGRAKPFHEWLNQDSNIPPIQKLFYNLKGFLQTFLGGIGGKMGADQWPMIGKIVGNLNDYDKDEKNPHTKGLGEAVDKVKDEQTQLAEWNREDAETVKLKAEYIKFSGLVGLNVKDIPEAHIDPEGKCTNEEEVLSKGMKLAEFKAIKGTLEGRKEGFTLYAFLQKLHKHESTKKLLTERTLADWKTFANLKDGEGEDASFIFTNDDLKDDEKPIDVKKIDTASEKIANEVFNKFPDKFKENLDKLSDESRAILTEWMNTKTKDGKPYLDFDEYEGEKRAFYNMDYGQWFHLDHPKFCLIENVDWMTDDAIKTHQEKIEKNKEMGSVLDRASETNVLIDKYKDYVMQRIEFDENVWSSVLPELLKEASFISLLKTPDKYWQGYQLNEIDLKNFKSARGKDLFDDSETTFHEANGGSCIEADGSGFWGDEQFNTVKDIIVWIASKS